MSATIQIENESHFTLDAGSLSLDFANTLDGRSDRNPREQLPDYTALLSFVRQAGLLDNATTQRLNQIAQQRPHEAHAVHASAIALREAIFRATFALANDHTPNRDDLRVIEHTLADALSHGGLASDVTGLRWSWTTAGANLARPLWPIVYAAFELLTRKDLSRLRVCAADDCDWLFLDESRNRTRKWCDMNTCGNRAKVARYRERRE